MLTAYCLQQKLSPSATRQSNLFHSRAIEIEAFKPSNIEVKMFLPEEPFSVTPYVYNYWLRVNLPEDLAQHILKWNFNIS